SGADADQTLDATPSGAVSNVQIGAVQFVTGNLTITPTLPAPSTPGTVLVATLANSSPAAFDTALAGFQTLIPFNSAAVRLEVRYYLNNPGGITSVTFTTTSGQTLKAQLSEWSGVVAVDQTGSNRVLGGATIDVATSAPNSSADDLGIAIYEL